MLYDPICVLYLVVLPSRTPSLKKYPLSRIKIHMVKCNHSAKKKLNSSSMHESFFFERFCLFYLTSERVKFISWLSFFLYENYRLMMRQNELLRLGVVVVWRERGYTTSKEEKNRWKGNAKKIRCRKVDKILDFLKKV